MTYRYDERPSPNRGGFTFRPEWITVHHWGARGQSHDGVARYLADGTRPGPTSAHFVVSAGRVTRLVPPTVAAWHARTEGNRRSIGIELRPEATDGDYATAAALIAALRRGEHGARPGAYPLTPHNRWVRTACPGVWNLARLDRLARAINTPDPVNEHTTPEVPEMLILTAPNGATFLAGAGAIAHVPGPADLAALIAAGVPQAKVSHEMLSNLGVR